MVFYQTRGAAIRGFPWAYDCLGGTCRYSRPPAHSLAASPVPAALAPRTAGPCPTGPWASGHRQRGKGGGLRRAAPLALARRSGGEAISAGGPWTFWASLMHLCTLYPRSERYYYLRAQRLFTQEVVMKRIWRGLVLAAIVGWGCVCGCGFANADWQYTRWGMSPGQIVSASSGVAKNYENPDMNRGQLRAHGSLSRW
jgi:hypothetical protein